MDELPSSLAGLRVLVLEDEPIIAMALEDQLEQAGAIPVSAGSITAAEDLLRDHSFDAAILDINVHGEKSYGVARALADQGTRFVFASGYGGAVHPEEFAKAPTVMKPYNLAGIARAIESIRAEQTPAG